VFKDSPHVWAGGLEGRDLANWLIGKANAILYRVYQQENWKNIVVQSPSWKLLKHLLWLTQALVFSAIV
jgi:hypothetical protein